MEEENENWTRSRQVCGRNQRARRRGKHVGWAGWDDDALDAEDHWNQTQKTAAKPILYNAHGIICKKGTCPEYARQIRLAKQAEGAEEPKTAADANKGKRSVPARVVVPAGRMTRTRKSP